MFHKLIESCCKSRVETTTLDHHHNTSKSSRITKYVQNGVLYTDSCLEKMRMTKVVYCVRKMCFTSLLTNSKSCCKSRVETTTLGHRLVYPSDTRNGELYTNMFLHSWTMSRGNIEWCCVHDYVRERGEEFTCIGERMAVIGRIVLTNTSKFMYLQEKLMLAQSSM